ncbi:MAG: hypothetical protein QM765_36830 [Myxococcales bacterium]
MAAAPHCTWMNSPRGSPRSVEAQVLLEGRRARIDFRRVELAQPERLDARERRRLEDQVEHVGPRRVEHDALHGRVGGDVQRAKHRAQALAHEVEAGRIHAVDGAL